MPGRGNLMDGHVGKWTNNKLLLWHFAEHQNAIISSKWDLFHLSRLALSWRGLDGSMLALLMTNDGQKAQITGLCLLLLTTLHNPCDHLLLAYTFFMITCRHNAKNYNCNESQELRSCLDRM
jgi:hypothetical protein